jgi:type IV pilus assembly protein PilY1
MNTSYRKDRPFFWPLVSKAVPIALLGTIGALAWKGPACAQVAIDQGPLAVSNTVTPNILFVIDNSGSMDSEVLLATNDGAAWWNTTNRSFVGLDGQDQEAAGVLNFNKAGLSSSAWKKYVYLFPNGTGSGNRVYADFANDHFALPPTPPFAWARSSAYNAIYYDDHETYAPWIGTDTHTFSDADTTCTMPDPIRGGNCVSLFTTNNNPGDNWLFMFEPGMYAPDGTTVIEQQPKAIAYYPAIFYEKITPNTRINNSLSYNCKAPDPAAYTWFTSNWRGSASAILATGVDAIAPDGSCLKKYEVKTGVAFPSGRTLADEQQNFANWFAYYRKRHLTLRAGVVMAMQPFKGLRVGAFTINNVATPIMRDLNTAKGQIFDQFYAIGGTDGGTPNRTAVNLAGELFDTDANIVQYRCQKNAALLFTDGYSTLESPEVGNVDSEWREPYSDSFRNTLADIAAKYYSTRLRAGSFDAAGVRISAACSLDGHDPWIDCNSDLHMNFYGVIMGAKGTLFGQTYFETQDAYENPPAWPDPTNERNPTQVDDLYHATIDGRGGLYDARTPTELRAALSKALGAIVEQFGTASSLAANSTRLDTGTVTYQAKYYSGDWRGDLEAYSVDPVTKQIASTALWRAADHIPGSALRKVYTYVPTASASQQYVPLSDPTKLSAAEQAALGSDAVTRQRITSYLRGDTSYELDNGGAYRNRETPLGDIVHSQPVYVGMPNPNLFVSKSFTGAETYNDFANAKDTRTPVVYVAANDGMLHGFNANSGVETYAYLPAAVIASGVSGLADPDYGWSVAHEFFNDGELTVADAYWSNAWHTVLVGTTGRGAAKAVYALDVTDPSNVGFLWERSVGDGKTNSEYIGQITGKPLIVQTPTGWSVLIGNGYNSAQDVAALLQFNLTDGSLSIHATDSTSENGMAAPASLDNVASSDGIQDVAYAGDLKGRVWQFSLSANNSSGTLLYTAKGNAAAQPITGGMLVGVDPETSNVWLFFGTGKYLSTSDAADTSVQTWYGLIVSSHVATAVDSSMDRSALAEREILVETERTETTLPSRGFTMGSADDMVGKSGWYLDLISPVHGEEGERMVTPNQFQGNALLGTSRIPDATDACNPTGRGWIMALNPFTGKNVSAPFLDINGDGVVDLADTITDVGSESTEADDASYPAGAVGVDSAPNNPIFAGNTMLVSFENGTTTAIETAGSTGENGRISWRELVGP